MKNTTALALLVGVAATTTGFVFPAPQLSSLVTRQRFASLSHPKTSSLSMSTLDKAPSMTPKAKDGIEAVHCIPLNQISLSDLPKVGG